MGEHRSGKLKNLQSPPIPTPDPGQRKRTTFPGWTWCGRYGCPNHARGQEPFQTLAFDDRKTLPRTGLVCRLRNAFRPFNHNATTGHLSPPAVIGNVPLRRRKSPPRFSLPRRDAYGSSIFWAIVSADALLELSRRGRTVSGRRRLLQHSCARCAGFLLGAVNLSPPYRTCSLGFGNPNTRAPCQSITRPGC